MFLVGKIVLFGILGENGKRCKSKEGSFRRYVVRAKMLQLLPATLLS